jgi:hypothetical protein
MALLRLTDAELWSKVEEDRLREAQRRAPYFAAFRATPEETKRRKAEDEHEARSASGSLQAFGEGLARAASEGVRFERYLVRQGYFPNVPVDHPIGIEPEQAKYRDS